MTQSELSKMDPGRRAAWLDSVSPTSSWSLGDDVFCLHCDAVFKAEDVACDHEGDPTCPVCKSSTPLDFHHIPWWRGDLVGEDFERGGYWKGTPITAVSGKPGQLPAER
jgi:hypothetical protein